MSIDYGQLPDELPVPTDDRGADHLVGTELPDVALPATSGGVVELSRLEGRSVVYAYPRTGVPDEPVFHENWNLIPGARGCTPESCGFRDHHAELAAAGAAVFGLSTQDTAFQRAAAERLELPFPLLSDDRLALTRALSLPTLQVNGITLLKRLTLIIRDGVVEHVFYPVFPPDAHAAEVLDWLTANDEHAAER